MINEIYFFEKKEKRRLFDKLYPCMQNTFSLPSTYLANNEINMQGHHIVRKLTYLYYKISRRYIQKKPNEAKAYEKDDFLCQLGIGHS